MADQPPGLDLDRLRRYLDAADPDLLPGPLSAELISGGKSNLTYRLTDGTRRLVLRRPPLGHVLATAHDMGREFEVMSALAGTAVPVPRTRLLCRDSDVLGADFYLMDDVDGTVYRDAVDTAGLGSERAHAISRQLIDVLADLHAVDPAAVGLEKFGRPVGYLERQVARWHRQFESSRSRDIPGAEELQQRLTEGIPTSQRATVVHGDYRLDNTVIAADDTIAAVLDWEMATLGDPLADLGLMKIYWEMGEQQPDNPVAHGVSPSAGFPPMAAIEGRYAERTGLDLTPMPWYTAFARYKLAVIAEGIYYRYLQGQTVGEGFGQMGDIVPGLIATALETLLGTNPDATSAGD
jgi:aminoglycoside phosphotransferase (APT) family kinase protein